MDLVSTEIIAFIIVITIAVDRRYLTKINAVIPDSRYVHLLFGYTLYLVISAVSHEIMGGDIAISMGFGQAISMLHIISFPALLLHWTCQLERDMLRPRAFRVISSVKVTSFLVFAAISIFDLINGRLYIFNHHFTISGGVGMYLMLAIGGVYCLTTLIIFISARNTGRPNISVVYGVIPVFMLTSLVLFHVVKQHDLFTIGASFMLLLIHLLTQHKRMALDELTQVVNQNGFLIHSDMVLERGADITLIIIDIENFRYINQQYGNNAAHAILQQFARFLSTLVPGATVFRIGGNRFTLSMPRATHNELVRLVKAIWKKTASGWHVDEAQISFHVNIGIIELPVQAHSKEELFDAIDFLFSEMKLRRRQSVLIYNQRLTRIRQRQSDILTALRKAISQPERIQVYYQPIYSSLSGRLSSAEALMRIEDPDLGMIMPGEFIVAAERAGLIQRITEIMLEKVCVFLNTHGTQNPLLSYVSVNVSAEDFSTNDIADRLYEIIMHHHIDPKRLCFEMTESELFSSFADVKDVWDRFSQLGVRFALDDFGTGYSNLETLVNVPFDIVKIDRKVVSNSKNNFELINMISVMLERLGKQIVAEGVETTEELEFVEAAGIHFIQGFLFSRPVPEQQFLDILTFESSK